MLKQALSLQARNPTGFFGRFFMPFLFDKGHARLHSGMVKHVAAGANDRILEIGFGSGKCVHRMANALVDGVVEGIDTSKVMVDSASRKNRKHIAAGRVRLVHGDFNETDFPPGYFNTVCSSHTVYFWDDLAATCKRIHSILKPGGRLVLAFVDKEKMQNLPLDFTLFTPVSHQELEGVLYNAGFRDVSTNSLNNKHHEYCIVAMA